MKILSSIRRTTPSQGELEKLYGEQNHIWRVMAKYMRSGQVHYLARWQPTFRMLDHTEEYRKIHYVPADVQKVTQFGP